MVIWVWADNALIVLWAAALGFSSQDVNLAAVLALQDYRSGTNLYEETLGNVFSAYFSTHNNSFLSSLP